jgi:hypothetical protein
VFAQLIFVFWSPNFFKLSTFADLKKMSSSSLASLHSEADTVIVDKPDSLSDVNPESVKFKAEVTSDANSNPHSHSHTNSESISESELSSDEGGLRTRFSSAVDLKGLPERRGSKFTSTLSILRHAIRGGMRSYLIGISSRGTLAVIFAFLKLIQARRPSRSRWGDSFKYWYYL